MRYHGRTCRWGLIELLIFLRVTYFGDGQAEELHVLATDQTVLLLKGLKEAFLIKFGSHFGGLRS